MGMSCQPIAGYEREMFSAGCTMNIGSKKLLREVASTFCGAQANDDQRRLVQTILFNKGLAYSAKTKSLNPDNSTLFNVLQEMNPENLRLASPTGFEPVLPP
jgi:hypothetical protein